jgi:hypothetical protein
MSTEQRKLPACLPSGAAWFAAGTQDGACHYGELHTQGTVHAVCGAVFTPTTNPIDGAVNWWRRPVDAEHGCGQCREAR